MFGVTGCGPTGATGTVEGNSTAHEETFSRADELTAYAREHLYGIVMSKSAHVLGIAFQAQLSQFKLMEAPTFPENPAELAEGEPLPEALRDFLLTTDPSTFHDLEATEKQRVQMATTLRYLQHSLQNLEGFKGSEHAKLHNACYAHASALLERATSEEAKLERADFYYNSQAFVVAKWTNPEITADEILANYDRAEQLFKEALGEESPKFRSRKLQCLNMKAIICSREGNDFARADQYFVETIRLREGMGESRENLTLLANARNARAGNLLKMDEPNAALALELTQAANAYYAEHLPDHIYRPSMMLTQARIQFTLGNLNDARLGLQACLMWLRGHPGSEDQKLNQEWLQLSTEVTDAMVQQVAQQAFAQIAQQAIAQQDAGGPQQ